MEQPATSGSSDSRGVHSYSADASHDEIARFEKVAGEVQKKLKASLEKISVSGKTDLPFTYSRDAETVYVTYPKGVNAGDLLGGLITFLVTLVPQAVVRFSDQVWAEPEWTTESRHHLAGFISGVMAPPRSFVSSTAPHDIARLALWVNTCSMALSRPGGVKDAQGSVLPTAIGGAKSASKYLTRVFSGLKGGISDEATVAALDTLSVLLKMWQRTQAETALALVRKCKISWGTVVMAGSPTKIIKGKKGKPDQQVVDSPSKPSTSPWAHPRERQLLSALWKDDWSYPDMRRIEWQLLSAEQQHANYESFIHDLKVHYDKINKISSSVHSKLGHRKKWIVLTCNQSGVQPRSKKDKDDWFKWSAAFYKLKLSALGLPIKKAFAPSEYLIAPQYRSQEVYASLFADPGETNVVTAEDFSDIPDERIRELWSSWANIFAPEFPQRGQLIPDALSLSDDNIFRHLADVESA